MVTAEEIRERMQILNQKREQALADANAYAGAIQDCQFWLARMLDGDQTETNIQKPELVRG